jgi:hypothetical protein
MSKGRCIVYSAAELAFIKRGSRQSRRELHAQFVARFKRRNITLDHIKSLCWRKGWKTGRTGCFEKGAEPANKGKEMPYNANSARTRFKKGNRSGRAKLQYKPLGTRRLSKDGYAEIKIHDGLPLQSRWRAVHLVEWEKKNGPLPKGHCLKSLDSNRLNTDPSNWELIPRALLARLSGRFGRGYDDAPADLKPTIMAVARLEQRLHEKGKP